jgi:hypothetical protein
MIKINPGPDATVADLQRAERLGEMLAGERERVSAAALAWRNGLAGLLVALAGFSLIKGRSDISELTPVPGRIVGILLLLAVGTGAAGALSLLRAAHGRPSILDATRVQPGVIADHEEALAAAHALRRGIALTLVCAVLLVGAVGTTWYGPAHAKPTATTSAHAPR